MFWLMVMVPVNALAPWCPARAWIMFLACEDKKIRFLRCIFVLFLVLMFFPDIKERNWLQLLFYFLVLMGINDSLSGKNSFIQVSGFRLKFSRLAVSQKRLQWESKTDLTTALLIMEWFVRTCLDLSTSYVHGLKSVWISQLFFFFDEIKLFRWFVWAGFWSVLWKNLYFSAIGFCNIDW